jgi:F0F1-type ATP synthase membrane subunit b/b'
MYGKFSKVGICALALVCALLLVPTQGQAKDNCEKRVQKAEENLHNAERRHGEHSRQAEERRHQLEEARERCHEHHEHH